MSDANAPEPARTSPSVRVHYPDERLRSFVTFYYFVDCDGPLQDFLYPEWGNVRFNVGGTWSMRMADRYPDAPLLSPLFGPTDRAAEIVSAGGGIAGFGLTPLGWERFLPMPASALANRTCELTELFGTPMPDLRRQLAAHDGDDRGVALFDRLLLGQLARSQPNGALAISIDKVLRDRPVDVEAFAAAAGVSTQTLRRACLRTFGFGPKRLLRRQRFLDTLGRIRVTDKPEFSVLIDSEYFDQSHFNREFREFMGLSPSAYLSVPRPLMRQAAEAQARIGIPLSFRLPPPPAA